MYWTREVGEAISTEGHKGLSKYGEKCTAELNKIVSLVRGQLTSLERATCGALVVIDVHARDVTLQVSFTPITCHVGVLPEIVDDYRFLKHALDAALKIPELKLTNTKDPQVMLTTSHHVRVSQNCSSGPRYLRTKGTLGMALSCLHAVVGISICLLHTVTKLRTVDFYGHDITMRCQPM